MKLYPKLCIVLLGTSLSSFLLRYECKKLDGYEFPVYSTEFCPRNQEEWKHRSSAINCTNTNGYMCLPNENLTELLEFCYIYPRMLIQKDLCLHLVKRYSRVNSYNCSNFKYGCPEDNYLSSDIFHYPSCIKVENGCFFAEPSCKSKTTTYAPETTNFKQTGNIPEYTTVTFYHESTEQIQNENENMGEIVLIATLVGVLILIFSFCTLFIYVRKKHQICRTNGDVESAVWEKLTISKIQAINIGQSKEELHEEEEIGLLLGDEKYVNKGADSRGKEEIKAITNADQQIIMSSGNHEESQIVQAIFDKWKQDDSCFISTKANEEVEKLIESRNLVIVAGHSGSGKSAIIQHIALKYREQGWTVRRVKKVEDIADEYFSSGFQINKTICVINDPFGKESFDEILNNSWQTYEEELKLYLKTAKLLMSCRNHIISDPRLTRYLLNESDIVDLEKTKYKLSGDEKRQILTQYSSHTNLSKKDSDKIVEVERYFPLLCKLYFSKEEYKNKGLEFFTEPVTVLKEEIIGFRKKDKGKYCALALLVLFNDGLCVSELLENKDTEYKFKHTLKLCGLPDNTPLSEIEDNLDSIKNFFVKKVKDTYHFYHDFVMEVTTYVFGTDYPLQLIKYADISFLRRRVKFGDCIEHDDSFTIYLSDRYIEQLGERFFTELFGERLVDVILNPCLRNEKVIKVLEKKIADHPKNLQMLLEAKKFKIDEQEFDRTSKDLLLSKLNFLKLDNSLENEVSTLFVLTVFCHTQLSQYCVNILQQKQINFTRFNLISAMCCNGSIELFNNVLKDHAEESFKKTWGDLYPIHILSVFHNYELLHKLIKKGLEVNQRTDGYSGWTPLILASGNDTQEYGDYKHEEAGVIRRNKTVQLLLSNGADINLCMEDGASPLFKACQNGHDSTIQLLLSNGADINLCEEHGSGPLYVACQNGHDSTVQLLLSNEADINLCNKNGDSPLFVACQNRHDSTVQLLLSNRADINLCKEHGSSPLNIACQNGHDSTVQLLPSNGADINLCMKDGVSPLFIACQNGHDSTVQLLLSNGADINLCNKNGSSPLYIACQNGHDSTVQLLLSNGADINLCEEHGSGPLYVACQNGHDSTVQLLLSNKADINLCMEDGASPLSIACQNGHDSTVQLLLSNEADINLCMEDGASPLYIACQNGHDSTVQLLLSNGADINLGMEDGASLLFIACQNGHDTTVQLLLSNGADINLGMEDGASPLYIACQNGHDSTVQLLLSNGADINLCKKNGASPLFIACQNGYDSTVQLLLSNGADFNLWEKHGASPFSVACQNGHDSIVQLLISNGDKKVSCLENETSPRYMACQKRTSRT